MNRKPAFLRSTFIRSTTILALSLGIGAPAFAAEGTALDDPDAQITSKVQAALAADKRLQVREPLEVKTRGGVVSLVGDVTSASMVYRAVEVTRGVDGVKDVDTNRLEAR